MIAKLFVHPMIIPFNTILWLILPLCVSVAVVYKTIRVRRLRQLPLEAGVLVVYMIGGLLVLGASLWVIHEYWP